MTTNVHKVKWVSNVGIHPYESMKRFVRFNDTIVETVGLTPNIPGNKLLVSKNKLYRT